MLYLEYLEVDDPVLEKIESKHNISFAEVREACVSDEAHLRKGKEGKYKLFGTTAAGRYVFVVLAPRGHGDWKVVTARDMTEDEKRLYSKAKGGR